MIEVERNNKEQHILIFSNIVLFFDNEETNIYFHNKKNINLKYKV
jgi:hypothetical protein